MFVPVHQPFFFLNQARVSSPLCALMPILASKRYASHTLTLLICSSHSVIFIRLYFKISSASPSGGLQHSVHAMAPSS